MLNPVDKKDKWHLDRYGKFTASEIWKLLSKGKGSETFGEGAKTYIKQKAVECMTTLWERPELESLKGLLHGRVHELPAFLMYQKVSRNNSMRYLGTEEPLFLEYNEYSGGSPDGIMGEGNIIKWGLESKCPINPNIHFDYLQMKDQWDLKEYSIPYYSQVQFLLMTTKAEGWHFESFDDRFLNYKHKIKVIEVLPDKNFQDNLDIRLQLAEKEKQKIINSLS